MSNHLINKKPVLVLAPMAGYTDSAFRIVCLDGGADLVYTEMISVEGLWRKNQKTLDMLKFLPQEKNVVIQLFGANPESFAKALKVINCLCHPELVDGSPKSRNKYGMTHKLAGIDINLGCPAHKVTKTGAGALLMDNKKTARNIVETVLKNTKLPVSIKIRSKVKNTTALDFIDYIKDLPWTTVMVHGRTLNQGMAGTVDFDMIKRIKELLPDKIVIANGGVNTLVDAQKLLTKTGADGLGIGRGALGRPWLFKEIKKGKIIKVDLKKIILDHAQLFLKNNNNLIPLRKHLIWYFKSQPNSNLIRNKLIKVETLAELKEILAKNNQQI